MASVTLKSTSLLLLLFYLFQHFLFTKVGASSHHNSTKDHYYGKYIGSFMQYEHNVSGHAYAIDARRIVLKHFYYDGTAPAAHFWIGIRGISDVLPDILGVALAEDEKRLVALGPYEDATVFLTLPTRLTLHDIIWLSIWCRKFEVNFGHVIIPPDIQVPSHVLLGQFSEDLEKNGTRSGPITIIDHKTIIIEAFSHRDIQKDIYIAVGAIVSNDNITEERQYLLEKISSRELESQNISNAHIDKTENISTLDNGTVNEENITTAELEISQINDTDTIIQSDPQNITIELPGIQDITSELPGIQDITSELPDEYINSWSEPKDFIIELPEELSVFDLTYLATYAPTADEIKYSMADGSFATVNLGGEFLAKITWPASDELNVPLHISLD